MIFFKKNYTLQFYFFAKTILTFKGWFGYYIYSEYDRYIAGKYHHFFIIELPGLSPGSFVLSKGYKGRHGLTSITTHYLVILSPSKGQKRLYKSKLLENYHT